MRKPVLLVTAALVPLAVLSCDTGEPDLYPDIAGTYDFRANVEVGTPGYYQGVLILVQPSRKTGEFDGTVQVQWVGEAPPNGANWSISGGIYDTRLTRDGSIDFYFPSVFTWRHVGAVSGDRIEGDWIRSGTDQSGTFIAIRRRR